MGHLQRVYVLKIDVRRLKTAVHDLSCDALTFKACEALDIVDPAR